MKLFFSYILLCDHKIFYVGSTSDLNKRLHQHVNIQSHYTKQFHEINLVYYEKHNTSTEAQKREKQFKGWSHEKKELFIRTRISKSPEFAEELARMRSLC